MNGQDIGNAIAGQIIRFVAVVFVIAALLGAGITWLILK